MNNLWNDALAQTCQDELALRVYTSRLLGQDKSLVLHGGGNTSVKRAVKNIFGEEEQILYVKGSGWDLETIEEAGDRFRKDGADRFPGSGDHPVPGPCVSGRILCPAANPGLDAGHGRGAGHFPETQGGVTTKG